MKIGDLCKSLKADVQVAGDINREICKVAAGDLLSFVMGTVPEGAAWITVQAHLNVAAVAVLKEIPIIIIAAGRKAPADLIERCETENICIASVRETVYGTCCKMAELGFGE